MDRPSTTRQHSTGRLFTWPAMPTIPMKFAIPFLERASLEESDSELVDLWSNLLASAAEEFDPHPIHFVSIVSRISPSQGEIPKEIIGTQSLELLKNII